MHHGLYTIRAHGDVTKLELEDGLIRGAVASLLSEPSTIVEVLVDVPRDASSDLPHDAEPTPDSAQILITASSESDAESDVATLIAEVAIVERAGRVIHAALVAPEGEWPGSATPGVTLRIRANRASTVEQQAFTQWVDESLLTISSRLGGIAARSSTATQDDGDLPSMSASLTFPSTEEAFDAMSSGALSSLLESDLIDPATVQIDLVTEHRFKPNPNTWTESSL